LTSSHDANNSRRYPSPYTAHSNGVRLRRITSIATERTSATFRVLEYPLPDLEAQLRLNAAALIILSDKTVEGRVVRYDSDRRNWYEFTVESE
jgi:hypothetical protein